MIKDVVAILVLIQQILREHCFPPCPELQRSVLWWEVTSKALTHQVPVSAPLLSDPGQAFMLPVK